MGIVLLANPDKIRLRKVEFSGAIKMKICTQVSREKLKLWPSGWGIGFTVGPLWLDRAVETD